MFSYNLLFIFAVKYIKYFEFSVHIYNQILLQSTSETKPKHQTDQSMHEKNTQLLKSTSSNILIKMIGSARSSVTLEIHVE